jgi:hypothetical protein
LPHHLNRGSHKRFGAIESGAIVANYQGKARHPDPFSATIEGAIRSGIEAATLLA